MMSAAAWIRRQRDRPTPEQDRGAALAAVIASLVAAVLLFAVARPASHVGRASVGIRSWPAPAVQRGTATRAALRASRAFLTGYLAYVYGQAPVSVIGESTRALIVALEASPPRPSPATRARRARILTLTSTVSRAGRVAVSATVTDGGIVYYTLGLLLARDHGRVLVAGLEGG
jgi:hypothetical protein